MNAVKGISATSANSIIETVGVIRASEQIPAWVWFGMLLRQRVAGE